MGRCKSLWIVCGILTVGCSAFSNIEEPVIVDLRHDYWHCYVHDRPLLEDLQPAAWEERQVLFWPEKDRLFPFAQNDIWLSGRERVIFARVMYCPECRVAKGDWLAAEASKRQSLAKASDRPVADTSAASN